MGTTYAIGDLHGEITLLHQLLNLLPLQPDDQLIFLGDYMDRGEDSVATVLFLIDLTKQQPCLFIRGNHDEEWLEFWNSERFTRPPAIPGARKVWEQHQGQIPPAIGTFLEYTTFFHEDGFAYYSHAGAQPGIPFWQSPREVYVWGWHDLFTNPARRWGKPAVFGHYEQAAPYVTDALICLDTAAYRSGILTAMRMEDKRIFQAVRSPVA